MKKMRMFFVLFLFCCGAFFISPAMAQEKEEKKEDSPVQKIQRQLKNIIQQLAQDPKVRRFLNQTGQQLNHLQWRLQRRMTNFQKEFGQFLKEFQREFPREMERTMRNLPRDLEYLGRNLKKLPQELQRELRRELQRLPQNLDSLRRDLQRLPREVQRELERGLRQLERNLQAQDIEKILKNLPPELRRLPPVQQILKNLESAKKAANETAAVGTLRSLFSCEMQFRILKKKNGEYGTFAELESEGLFSSFTKRVGDNVGFKSGYKFTLKISDSGKKLEILAEPLSSSLGNRKFFMDASGSIRYTTDGSTPDANSPSLD